MSFTVNCGLCGVHEFRVIVQMETTWTNLIAGAAVPMATQRGSKLIFLKPVAARGVASPWFIAGSHRVLATAVDDWLENLLALAPVRAYASYVQQ